MNVARPLWRAFAPERLAEAAAHARAGGLSVVTGRRWRLLGDAGPPDADVPLLVDWAIRAIEAPRWAEITRGVARGCVGAPISRDWHERVSDWLRRDAAHPGATAQATFDCTRCAACCVDNEVVLSRKDVRRFAAGGRDDVRASAVRRGRKLLLPLLPTPRKECIHLRSDLLCAIYEVRPDMCREFPPGCEQCMTSREEVFGTAFPQGR